MFSTRFSTFRDFTSDWYQEWRQELKLPQTVHRKWWELAIVAETLRSHGMLGSTRKGIGFGCGSERITTQIADFGPTILATDLLKPEWAQTHQDFANLASHPGVTTRVVDMNWLDGASGVGAVELEHYDFAWSVCSMDHCGSTWLTKRFLLNQLNCLKPDGVGIHTAEYTISLGLPKSGATVWLDWADLVDTAQLIGQLGHELAPIDWNIGDAIEDHKIDPWPHGTTPHLKPEVHAGRWGTCVAFAVKKKSNGVFWVPQEEDLARDMIGRHQRSHSQT